MTCIKIQKVVDICVKSGMIKKYDGPHLTICLINSQTAGVREGKTGDREYD